MPACLGREGGTAGLVVERLDHLDDVLVGREDVERLDLLQFLHLLQRVELLLHALDCHVFARLERERREDHRERPAALLVLQLVLVHPY